MISNNDTDIAWLAGIIEGEATFVWQQGRPRIVVAMTDLDIIEKIESIVESGTKIYVDEKPNCKPLYKWGVSKRSTLVDLMQKIRPHMGQRRGARIDEFLQWYRDNPHQRRKWLKIDGEIIYI